MAEHARKEDWRKRLFVGVVFRRRVVVRLPSERDLVLSGGDLFA